MVDTGTEIRIRVNGKNINITPKCKLDCNSRGIYTAICTQPNCNANYVGQTSTTFRTRFNGHRSKWVKKAASQANRNDTALLDHYREFHPNVHQNWCDKGAVLSGFDQAFRIVIIDKIGPNLLEQEDFWQKRLRSKINRCNIITPAIIE